MASKEDEIAAGDLIAGMTVVEVAEKYWGWDQTAVFLVPTDEVAPTPGREWVLKTRSPEELARAFHEAYERLAPDYGYKTREASAVPWSDVPENNKRLMIATAGEVLKEL